MSFATQVRAEILRGAPKKGCCRKAEFYGMLLFCTAFSSSQIKFQTENAETAKYFLWLGNVVCGRDFSLSCSSGIGEPLYSVWIEGEDAEFCRKRMGHEQEVQLHLHQQNMEHECCSTAFLRGAFLAGGSVGSPEKHYRLEFATPHYALADELCIRLQEFSLLPARAERNGQHIVYFKASEQICDLLTVLSAPHAAMEIMNVKIEKDIRNHANRVTNCETANIGKTVSAAAKQTEAIRRIEQAGLLETLPGELLQVAELRLQNPECSLTELREMTYPVLSKSGLNHRLSKLIAISEEL